MVPWVERPVLDIDMDLPVRQRYQALPTEAFACGRRLLGEVMQEVPPAARLLADWVRVRTLNRFHNEAVSLAQQIGASWREVMLANVSYDLLLASFGCSTVVLATPSGPVVARNMDWSPEVPLAQTSYLVRCHKGGKLAFANAGWPGAIGVVTGLSGRGFAVVLNAVIGPEMRHTTGYPVLLHLRRVIEDAPDFDAALQMLTGQTLAAPGLFTLVGSQNEQRVVVERSPTRHAIRRPQGDEPLFTTNDYRLLFQTQASDQSELYRTTCSRYEALCRHFARSRPDRPVTDAELLYVLSDSSVIQSITAQQIVMRPRSGEIRLYVPRRLLPDA